MHSMTILIMFVIRYKINRVVNIHIYRKIYRYLWS